MPIFSGEWSGIPNVLITIVMGLVLMTLAAIVADRVNRKMCKHIIMGLTVGLYMMVSFTSSKSCSIIVGGKEFFIIAGSLMFPVLAYGLDIINEFWGKKSAKAAVHAQLIARILTTVYLIWIIYLPAPSGEQENFFMFRDLMQILPRITAASVIAGYISGVFDIHV